MRLFIGVPLPAEINHHLDETIGALKDLTDLKWARSGLRHITLKFLGEVADDKIIDIQSLMDKEISRHPSFPLFLEGAGVFPGMDHPRVFWTGLQGEWKKLRRLATSIEEGLIHIGFPPENRSFRPHLTLVRNTSADAAKRFCAAFAAYKSPSFLVESVCLVHSALGGPRGTQYNVIHQCSLKETNQAPC